MKLPVSVPKIISKNIPAFTKFLPVYFKLQKFIAPALIGAAVTGGFVMSIPKLRRDNARRKRWFAPILIIGVLLLAGFTGGVVEYAINSQPHMQCVNGTFTSNDGTLTCRAVLATSVPATATARCNDGTYSFSRSNLQCSRHGGVQVSLP